MVQYKNKWVYHKSVGFFSYEESTVAQYLSWYKK